MRLLAMLAKAILHPVRIAFIDDDKVFLKSLEMQAKQCNTSTKVPFRIEVRTFSTPECFEAFVNNPKNPRMDYIFVDMALNENKKGSEWIKEWISKGIISRSRIMILSADVTKCETNNPFVWCKPFILMHFLSHLKEILSIDVLSSRLMLVQSLHMNPNLHSV
jgi:hypothetical protein